MPFTWTDCSVAHDLIGGCSRVIRSAGSDIHNAGNNGQLRAFFELHQIMSHDVCGCDASTRAVDAQDDAAVRRASFDGVQLFAKEGDGVFAGRQQAGGILVQQYAIDVDNRNLSRVVATRLHHHFDKRGIILEWHVDRDRHVARCHADRQFVRHDFDRYETSKHARDDSQRATATAC